MKKKTDTPTQAEFGSLRSKLAQMGMSQTQIIESIGVERLPRSEIAERLIAWLRGNDVRIST